MPVPGLPAIESLTHGSLLDFLAEGRPEREALVYPHRELRLSYRDLHARATELARGLIACGVEEGERVVLWSDNHPDWVPLQFALAKIGAVLVTANTALARPEIAYLLKQSRSAGIICAPGFLGREYFDALLDIEASGESPPELRLRISFHGDAPEGFISLDDLIARGQHVPVADVEARCAATRPEQPANIQYTSGTTGFPKGVVLTHRNILVNAYVTGDCIRVHDEDRVLLQVPLFHCFGCIVTVLGAFTQGITVVAVDRFDPQRCLEAIERERVTIVHGVPTMFLALLSHQDFAKFDLRSLRAGIMAGTMCPEPLMRRVIDEMNVTEILSAYGLTETSPAATCSHPEDSVAVRCGSVGRPIPGVEVRIVDPKTLEELPTGVVGEVWIRGPNVMEGYFDDPENTAKTMHGDWLRSGDLGTMDDDDVVRIVGRIKELIIRGGENISPGEVEDAIRAHAAVHDAAVFGLPSERLGEIVAAAVILEPDSELSLEELKEFLRGRISHFKRPSELFIVEEFPTTASGKVQKFVLQERFG